jgi:hypothetical protein
MQDYEHFGTDCTNITNKTGHYYTTYPPTICNSKVPHNLQSKIPIKIVFIRGHGLDPLSITERPMKYTAVEKIESKKLFMVVA